MSEKQFRNKIYWLTFCFSLIVVWVHSNNWELFLGQRPEGEAVALIERILGESLGQMAVPGFFLVSGYLFFRTFSLRRLPSKWKSRIRSVAVPYVLWNLIYYAGYFFASRLPFLQPFLNREPIPVNWAILIQAAFFNLYNPVFWYLHQLILLIILAPILYFFLKQNITALLFTAFLVWAVYTGWRLGPVNTDAMLYYGAGAWAALHREEAGSFAESGDIRKWLLPGAVLALWAGIVFALNRPGQILYNNPLAAVTCRLTMASAFWALISILPFPEAGDFAKHNFFLYAIHFAWVRLFNKAGAVLFQGSAAAALIFYFGMPFLMVWLNLWIGRALRKAAPPVYDLLAGGR